MGGVVLGQRSARGGFGNRAHGKVTILMCKDRGRMPHIFFALYDTTIAFTTEFYRE